MNAQAPVRTRTSPRASTHALRWWDLDDVLAVEGPSFGPDAWTREGFLSELSERESRTYLVLRESPGDGRDAEAEDRRDDEAGTRPGALLGYVGIAVHGPDADVQTLAVAPGHRGRGLGRSLVALAVDRARAAGARRLGLEVREDNEAALALYGAAGFARQGRRPGYYAGTVPGQGRVAALLMQADLVARTDAGDRSGSEDPS